MKFDLASVIIPGMAKRKNTELTKRETEILRLAAHGHTNKSIGSELGIAQGTISCHIGNILKKTGSASRTEAVVKCFCR